MKLKKTTKALIIGCIVGLSLLLYPSFSNYWNSKHATQAISSYVESIEDVDEDMYRELWENAIQFNQGILERANPYVLSDAERERYNANLNLTTSGIMGFIEIAKLGVSLPIYHGTSDVVLQIAVGHLEWTSLPTGGESTHCVLSGHRGLPSAKLFTDLDQLREGDTFTLNIIDEILTYEVDQIRVVEPNDAADLLIEEGMDYCTLVTCTPYGINTHRLLVRGHRIENAAVAVRVVSEAVVIDPLVVAPVVAFPFLFILMMMVMLKKPPQKPIPLETLIKNGGILNDTQKTDSDSAHSEPDSDGCADDTSGESGGEH